MEFSRKSKVFCDSIGMDQACVTLNSELSQRVVFQHQTMECEGCDLTNTKILHSHDMENVTLDFVSFGTSWQVLNNNNETICRNVNKFEESSWFTLTINETDCTLKQNESVPSPYIPLAIAFALLLLLAFLWELCRFLYRKKAWEWVLRNQSSLAVSSELATAYSSTSSVEEEKEKRAKQRLRSLDTVRGIALVVMIFVNYGGGKYWFFHHARWNGLTVADLVFPWFIWMMGLSIIISLRSQLRKLVPRKVIFQKIVKRSIILFSLGLMLNTLCLDVDLKDIRICGVLQRFGISYFVVATLHLFFAEPDDIQIVCPLSSVRDIVAFWVEWLVMLALLTTHILLTFFLHAPECPQGYLGPGGLHLGGNFSLCTGGAAGYIDQLVLGERHLYQRPTFKSVYKNTQPYDPEGILGYLTSIFLVFLGLQAGKILVIYQTSKDRLIRWLSWGLVLGLLAVLLSKGSENAGWIPINKNLWSVSFIFATGSLAFVLMSFCYYVIDVKRWWTGAPFFCAGMNSIFLYVGHSITGSVFPWSWQVPLTHAAQLAMDIWGTALWVIIAACAYHNEFFITV